MFNFILKFDSQTSPEKPAVSVFRQRLSRGCCAVRAGNSFIGDKMALEDVIRKIKSNPDYRKCGMILYHNGIVRETSGDGEAVKTLKIHVDYPALERLISEQKKKDGIVDIIVEIYDGKVLFPGG